MISDKLSDVISSSLRIIDNQPQIIEICEDGALDWNSRETAVLHIVLEGAVDIIGDRNTVSSSLEAGEAALLFYGDEHRISCAPMASTPDLLPLPTDRFDLEVVRYGHGRVAARLLTVLLKFSYVSSTAYTVRTGNSLWLMRRSSDAVSALPLFNDTRSIYEECRNPGGRAFLDAFINLTFVRAIRSMHWALWEGKLLESWTTTSRPIASAMLAVRRAPDHPWTIGSLARAVGLSRSSFAANFSQQTGVAPMAFVTQVRMERAAELIRSGNLRLAIVAARVGYTSASSFSRKFALYYRRTPGQYRSDGQLQLDEREKPEK